MEFMKRIDMTALHLAVKNDKIEIVRSLLDHKGIDINVKDSVTLNYL